MSGSDDEDRLALGFAKSLGAAVLLVATGRWAWTARTVELAVGAVLAVPFLAYYLWWKLAPVNRRLRAQYRPPAPEPGADRRPGVTPERPPDGPTER